MKWGEGLGTVVGREVVQAMVCWECRGLEERQVVDQ